MTQRGRPTYLIFLTDGLPTEGVTESGRILDNFAREAPDTVVVSASNSRPVADAGADREVTVGGAVTLDSAASTDADGEAAVAHEPARDQEDHRHGAGASDRAQRPAA